MNFKYLYFADKQRNRGKILFFLWFLRHAQCSIGPIKFLYLIFLRRMRYRYGLEISHLSKIGRGLYLGHPFNITVNPEAVIGEWCNLHKGVTIGFQNRGKFKGAPTIGNKVWIGVNATVVGKVKIGDDVLIAPGAYVNCDVPSHSVVIGNPCQIHHRDNATEGYINHVIE